MLLSDSLDCAVIPAAPGDAVLPRAEVAGWTLDGETNRVQMDGQ